MPNPVVQFEIYADNPERLAGFYRELFGWEIAAVPGMEYWLIRTVPSDAQGVPTVPGGINGGLMKRPRPDARNWLNCVSVGSIDQTLEKAQAAGAVVFRPKSAVPRIGWFAVLADPEMNVFALWQDDPDAAWRLGGPPGTCYTLNGAHPARP
ncbi:MAG: VOC family protein [Armatimonadota bacterium]|nr:VOC family protein [Armatimonadota bacterium]MDR7427613.1 VOC family protein [Armatimonadota bacterium]MDR7469581.1 VOC family protein [Armatimonadota bacterium]MDR7475834.1 VOC family protein [Armatimonadota bacterium]MDR7538301.1 VOC family protein [Armatimonadota bacterium]